MQIVITIVLTMIIFYFSADSLKDIFALIVSLGAAFVIQKIVKSIFKEMKETKKG